MDNKNTLFLLLSAMAFFSIPFTAQAQGNSKTGKKNVIVEYKRYESFDLGGLQIEGKVLAPGDLTIDDQGRDQTDYDLFNRRHFRKEIIKDVFNTR